MSNVKEDCILEELGILCGNDSKSDSDKSESSEDETSEMAVTQTAPVTWIVKMMVRIPIFHPTAVP